MGLSIFRSLNLTSCTFHIQVVTSKTMEVEAVCRCDASSQGGLRAEIHLSKKTRPQKLIRQKMATPPCSNAFPPVALRLLKLRTEFLTARRLSEKFQPGRLAATTVAPLRTVLKRLALSESRAKMRTIDVF